MHEYSLVKVLSPDIVVLAGDCGQHMFTLATLRKPTSCAHCGTGLAKGTQAFRPVSNGNDRYHRVCRGCVTHFVQESLQCAPTSRER